MLGPGRNPHLYILDHIITLSLGGHPTDPRNLQIQTVDEAAQKDRLEWRLLGMACYHHQITVAQAQAALSDLRSAYPVYCPTEAACPPYRDRD